MIDEKDFILKPRKIPGHFKKQYKGTCNKCGRNRGYIDKSRADQLCRSCARIDVHKNMDPSIKKKISEATTKQFTGTIPWNKGKNTESQFEQFQATQTKKELTKL